MPEFIAAPLRLVVEHRRLGEDGGPTLHVFEQGGAARELLRFDCFERGPHWHLAPHGPDRVTALRPGDDNVSWVFGELERDPTGYLERAGLERGHAPEAESFRRALRAAELAMRNPPLDLDTLDLERLRTRTGEKWALFPPDVIPAWVADMDFPVAEPIRRVLQGALDAGDLGYPINPRPGDLPALFAERMQERFGWSVRPGRVAVMTDVVQGIYVALETLCTEGDGVVVQTPIYPPFLDAVRETGRRRVTNELVQTSTGYEIDFDALEAELDGRTRVLLLSHPHNPTGRVFRGAELERLAEIALAHDLTVISDEIHQDLVFAPHRHVPFASLAPEIEARTLTLTSATKAFNIAGLRCAVAAFGSPAMQRSFDALPRHVRGGIGSLGMQATRAAWRWSQPWLDQVLGYCEANRRYVGEFVREHMPGVRYHLPEATYLAWLDYRALELPEGPFSFFLERARVGLSDGHRFGPGGDGFVRLNFATSRAILAQILERMAKALRGAGH